MTELLLVRHGRPESGRIDPPLNDEGIAQARRLARALEGAGVTALVSSDLRRARQTADIVGAAVGHAPTSLPGLREWGLPADAMEYVALEFLEGDDPRSTAIAEGRYMDFVPDVVDLTAFRATVVDAFDEILASHPAGRVAVVCHGGTINAYVGHLAGISDVFWFHPDYASVSRVERVRGGRVVIRSLNETPCVLVESN
ncbi:histidine phosphatase family protein [Prauserella endophytica]|uniref:Histidine phosphatase family protein n=1 Tax=Prauserella endophytica TaxID=1592324 RepID=A0ABY2S669_9PSEU|nr:histidine phosphatase family protein [Prauserella endophytica]TKG70966.1 histidine phosphatase family protein [Prauserella endophytica]